MDDIYTAAAKHNDLRQMLLLEYPELAEDGEALTDTLEGCSTFAEAVAAIVMSLDEDEALAEAAKQKVDVLKARAERFKARADRKRQALAEAMNRAAESKVTLPECTISLTRTQPKVIVTDEAALPKEYVVTRPAPPKPNLKAIGEALKGGQDVPGAVLSNPSLTVQIRRS
jgi:hypothetical protein